MLEFLKKVKIYKLFLAVGYILLLSPFVYAVFYSMPANDDFAWAITWWSDNRLVETVHRVGWNYMNYFGQSGIFAIVIQVLFNPLYWFDNAGHSFGISMVVVFLFVVAFTLLAVRQAFKYICHVYSEVALDLATFVTAAILFTCYYYNDVYNWWSGVPGYSMMMAVCIFAIAAIAKYQESHDSKSYRSMIILGMIACTSVMYCVPIGMFYVVYAFLLYRKNGDSLLKKLIPFALYVITGVLMVIAPGNFNRMGGEGTTASLKVSIIVSGARSFVRLVFSCIQKPWAVALICLIIIIGARFKSEEKVKWPYLILGVVAIFATAWGSILPYVYGSNKDMVTEIASRILFVEDYLVIIGFSILAFRFGQWLGGRVLTIAAGAVIVASLGFGFTHHLMNGIVPVDIVAHAQVIKDNYYFWNDILKEVKSAEPGSDVVIDRENVSWTLYTYTVGLDSDYKDPTPKSFPYGNCNQCVAKYYKLHSVVVNLN